MLSSETSSRRRRAALAHACVACQRPWAVRAVRNATGAYLLVCRYCSWQEARPAVAPTRPALSPATPRRPADHSVLFYDDEDELLQRLVTLVTDVVAANETCLLIATPEHRAALRQRVGTRTLLVARRQGALVELDAAATLRLLMRDGHPDPALFDQTIGALVRDQAAEGRPVRAYGEMVALLWATGADVAALELEAIWNALQRRVSLSLLCAYPSADVDLDAAGRTRICEQHTALAA